jgi:L-amino acid N-acyltransferase YncA
MTTPTVRAATETDIPAIAAIYRPAVLTGTASFELAPPDDAEMLRRFRTLTEAGYPYLVAEAEGRVLGYAYAGAYRPRPAYRFSVENSIYVAAEAQRSGVGRILLEALIDLCTAKGYRQMIAVIGDSAQSASIKLHRSAGFRFSGTIHSVGYKHGRWLDSVIMQLALGPGEATPPENGGQR